MMKRMLKRKIHPELECKVVPKSSEAQTKATILAESVSLLPIPGMYLLNYIHFD